MASRRRTLLKNLYSEKEEDVDVNINLIVPKKEKTCTVCIQQRLNYKNGTILNEKFVTVENKKTCHDIKIMKNIIEQNTPTTFGNPCGFYQRTRLIPIHNEPPYTDFIVLYIPIDSEEDEDEVKDIDEHSKCIDSDDDDEHILEDQMNTLSINNNNSNSDNTMNYIVDCIFDLPEDIIINFICKYLDPRSVVKLARTKFSSYTLILSGVVIGSLYGCCISYTNKHYEKYVKEQLDNNRTFTCNYELNCYLMTHAGGFNDLFMRKLSSSSAATRLLPTNLLKGVVCIYVLSEMFYYDKINDVDDNNDDDSNNYNDGRKAIHRVINLFENEFWNWEFNRLQKYILKHFQIIDMLRDIGRGAVNPLPNFENDHRLQNIFLWGSSFDEMLRVLTSSKSQFVYSKVDPDMHEQRLFSFSFSCFEYIRWLQRCRVDKNDYLLSKNATYILKRTKKQIFLLNDHTNEKIQKKNINSNDGKKNNNDVMDSKHSRYKKFELAPKALIYGFESLQQVYDLLWPTSSTTRSASNVISNEHKKRNLYMKRRRRSSLKRHGGIL